jgi:hypothetical protein
VERFSETEKQIILSGKDYVYGYFDPDTDEIFYVGKGKKFRLLSHLKHPDDPRNPAKTSKIFSLLDQGKKPNIKILCVGSKDYCCKIEHDLILQYGRIFSNDGPLTNIAEGGYGGNTGVSGFKAMRKKYGFAFIEKNLEKGRRNLVLKNGPGIRKKMGQRGVKTQRILYGDSFCDEMKRRSDLGNSYESNQKKKKTRIKNYGSLEEFYKVTQAKRLKTMKEKGGWSVKCFDLNTNQIKIVKKDEFDKSPYLVGMASKKIPNKYKLRKE